MSVYSTNFFSGNLPTTQTALYTVPSGVTVVIRDIEFVNANASNANPAINVTVAGSTVTVYLLGTLATFAWSQWKGRVVIPSGSTINGNCSVTNCQAIVSGYSLS